MPGTNLHTSILPVYDFVLDFLICYPRRGQSELETEDRKKGQGHSGSRSNSLLTHYIEDENTQNSRDSTDNMRPIFHFQTTMYAV